LNPKDLFVQNLFDRIARRYDLLNRVISFRVDSVWRKKAVAELRLAGERKLVLDLGTGTGDLALAAANRVGGKGTVVGLDFSDEMLRLAMKKTPRQYQEDRIVYVRASALEPPFKDNTFDGVMTAFVLRNISDLDLFFRRAYDLLKPGGRLVSLDMFPPRGGPFSLLYSLYFYRLVPWIGAALAGDRNAYRYLSESVKGFDPPESIAQTIRRAGFPEVRLRKFLRGAVCLHVGDKPGSAGSL
jgi:demethylmenaquinone methyltransferase/2-methoxy-6-polyprenyl-1,4-benzoquinol methylase